MKKKYRFFLNPYRNMAFTKCPKCEGKTKVRKFCLMIHCGPPKPRPGQRIQLLSLNKSCKFCPYCELIIAKKAELEEVLQPMFSQMGIPFSAENYFVMGTMSREDWKQNQKEPLEIKEAIKRIAVFRDVWDFEVRPAGWYFEDEN